MSVCVPGAEHLCVGVLLSAFRIGRKEISTKSTKKTNNALSAHARAQSKGKKPKAFPEAQPQARNSSSTFAHANPTLRRFATSQTGGCSPSVSLCLSLSLSLSLSVVLSFFLGVWGQAPGVRGRSAVRLWPGRAFSLSLSLFCVLGLGANPRRSVSNLVRWSQGLPLHPASNLNCPLHSACDPHYNKRAC